MVGFLKGLDERCDLGDLVSIVVGYYYFDHDLCLDYDGGFHGRRALSFFWPWILFDV